MSKLMHNERLKAAQLRQLLSNSPHVGWFSHIGARAATVVFSTFRGNRPGLVEGG
jgi:hypothetical protein